MPMSPTHTRQRWQVLDAVAARVHTIPAAVVRVAIDGVDGSGKTVFADELAAVLGERGRHVIRASVDDFHRPRADRYVRGRNSSSGYWLDAFDYQRLRQDLLDPLGPGGLRRFRRALHNVATDQYYADQAWEVAPPRSVLLLDGVFLHRDELYRLWDWSVWLQVPFEITAQRMFTRDGTDPDPDHPTMRRYVQAQRTYIQTCNPSARARTTIDNSDVSVPFVIDIA